MARAATVGEKLGQRLARLLAHPNVGNVRGRGLLCAVELVADKATREPFAAGAKLTEKVVAAGIAQGIFVCLGCVDLARDVITLGPPFAISEAEIELIGERLERAIESAVARLH